MGYLILSWYVFGVIFRGYFASKYNDITINGCIVVMIQGLLGPFLILLYLLDKYPNKIVLKRRKLIETYK